MSVLRRLVWGRLCAVIFTFVLIGVSVTYWQYWRDQQRIQILGPVVIEIREGDSIAWTKAPHVFARHRWFGPAFLENPMRMVGMPWFDRIVFVCIEYDSHVNPETAAGLADSVYLEEVEVWTKQSRRYLYQDLEKRAPGRIKVRIWDRSQH